MHQLGFRFCDASDSLDTEDLKPHSSCTLALPFYYFDGRIGSDLKFGALTMKDEFGARLSFGPYSHFWIGKELGSRFR